MGYVIDEIGTFEQELENLVQRCAHSVTDEQVCQALQRAKDKLEVKDN